MIELPPIKVTPVFHRNWQSHADIVINQGGTDSTKTYSILQVLATIATSTKAPMNDPIITVLSESIPNAKKGPYRTFEYILNSTPYFLGQLATWNKSDRTLHFKTGWIVEFVGVTDEQNAKQGKRQYLFVNEANDIPWQVFWQYAKRTRRKVYIDYNPSAPFWVHEKLIGTVPEGNDLHATVELIISDHRHNPFLSEQDHAKTENIKDPELWKVYARGITGNLSGIIYPAWQQISDADFPWDDERRFAGIDYGYTNDPTAAVTMVRVANTIYVHELCYEAGLTAQRISTLFKSCGYKGTERPIYSEHDPDMIRQLKQLNLYVVAARKTPGSIKAGISKVNEYQIRYTASSKNIDYERRKYMWVKDDDTGRFTNNPTEQDNHLMDAIRYGVFTHFYRNK